jgi:hypothetical protein
MSVAGQQPTSSVYPALPALPLTADIVAITSHIGLGLKSEIRSGAGMTRWTTSIVAMSLASIPCVVNAQADCNAVPAGPARTDCYLGLSQFYRAQSDLAAAKRARNQADRRWCLLARQCKTRQALGPSVAPVAAFVWACLVSDRMFQRG